MNSIVFASKRDNGGIPYFWIYPMMALLHSGFKLNFIYDIFIGYMKPSVEPVP
ncbi:hypothetical protein ECEC1846_4923 [Escherichia coli EC1846]|nr:conserved hypothetical protein [Escherichia coli O157:H7 str. EC508]EHV01862.1 hypothetical protein ECDEC4C_4703 [Escherichia coli DEC4C]EIN17401.1 hypothetical protein ECFRIK1996_4921 [Escherichia coli FRIK1996]EIO67891.1 hypothetical protein ECTW09098_4983 [Escherichia coli TW09098]EKH27660.1 hypothetical protein ECFRIK1999_5079 [Escherichia coli FRIK1999]EKI66305.1 hypothetical protein ECEC1846_4923 [Escherichia coli EC1846]EKW78160.1 hypothetical protein EC990672_4892 [Escherichia coli